MKLLNLVGLLLFVGSVNAQLVAVNLICKGHELVAGNSGYQGKILVAAATKARRPAAVRGG